jgi:hypothetical protein
MFGADEAMLLLIEDVFKLELLPVEETAIAIPELVLVAEELAKEELSININKLNYYHKTNLISEYNSILIIIINL